MVKKFGAVMENLPTLADIGAERGWMECLHQEIQDGKTHVWIIPSQKINSSMNKEIQRLIKE